jgi:uncharacterized protein YecE (DUF72 family)
MGRRPSQLDLFGAPPAPPRVGPAAVPPALTALAARLPPTLRLGTSSWSFPGWTGLVWDRAVGAATLAREGLAAYARHPLLRTVGLDRTFYAPMPAADLAALAAQVPEDFAFLVKAAEACTLARFPLHERYGSRRGLPNPQFLDAAWATDQVVGPVVSGLGRRAGPILFQLPPQPAAALGGPARFAERLHGFLDALPRGPLYAVEVRTPELLCRDYALVLADVGACHGFTAHPAMPSLAAQAARVAAADAAAPAVVVRWMLGHGQAYDAAKARYAPFDRLVDEDPDVRGQVADLVRRAGARPCFVVANNKAEGSAPRTLARLAAALVDDAG